MLKSVSIEEPDFETASDVVAKCPNGKIKNRSTSAIYVIMRIDLDGPDTDADVLGYSYDMEYGCPFIESIAARDAFGKFWDFKKQGSPCFDPLDDDGLPRAPPAGRFMMWDLLDAEESLTAASLTIYQNSAKPLRRYKLCLAQPTINDFLAIETEKDKLFL